MGCLWCFTSAKAFHLKVILLDKQELIQEIGAKTTGEDLLNNIFKYLNIVETSYFGLRYQDSNNQTHWLDPSKRVSRQIRGNQTHHVTLYLGVKFYAADPCKLAEEITRYQFFLQVKLDILQGRLPVTHELAVDLAALALQSELGDYDDSQHSPGYVSEFRFVAAQSEEMENDVEYAHASMAGMGITPATAEMTYLEKVKWLDMYGVDLHPVQGEDNIEYYLGLTPSGIIVLRNRSKVGNYFWPRITKIYFKGKYFMLRVRDKNNEENTYGFETPSRQSCKHLWRCCVEHDAFFRLLQANPSFNGHGVFSINSKSKYLPHQQQLKENRAAAAEVKRQQPQFTRRPSKRHSRRGRIDTLASTQSPHQEGQIQSAAVNIRTLASPAAGMQPSASVVANNPRLINEMMLANGSLKRQNYLNQKSLQRSHSNSLPRNMSLGPQAGQPGHSEVPAESFQDVSLQSLQWLESRGLYGGKANDDNLDTGKVQLPVSSGGSGRGHRSRGHLSEEVYTMQMNSNTDRKRVSRKSGAGGGSDNESDVSGVSWNGGGHHGVRRNRNESGSESEHGTARRQHRGRRKSRQGSYKLIETDEQWQSVQRQRGGGYQGQQQRSRSQGDKGRSQSNQYLHPHYQRRSGYLNSGAETESEVVTANSSSIHQPQAVVKRTRRRRSRSRSPAELKSSSRSALPDEVLKHLEFGLVEPNEDNIRGQIPFTNVQVDPNSSHVPSAATTRSINRLVFNHDHRQTGVSQNDLKSVVSENLAIVNRKNHLQKLQTQQEINQQRRSPWSKDDLHMQDRQNMEMTPPSYVATTARQYQQQQQYSPVVQQQLVRQQLKPPPPPPAQQRPSPYHYAAPPPSIRQPYRPALGSAGYSQGTNPSTPSPVGVVAPPVVPPAMRLAGSSSASSSATSLQHHLASKQMSESTRVYSVNNNHRHGLPPVKNGNNYQSPYQQNGGGAGEVPGMATLDVMWQQSQQMRQQNESYLPPTAMTHGQTANNSSYNSRQQQQQQQQQHQQVKLPPYGNHLSQWTPHHSNSPTQVAYNNNNNNSHHHHQYQHFQPPQQRFEVVPSPSSSSQQQFSGSSTVPSSGGPTIAAGAGSSSSRQQKAHATTGEVEMPPPPRDGEMSTEL